MNIANAYINSEVASLSFIELLKARRPIPARDNSFLPCSTARTTYWNLFLPLKLEHCHKGAPLFVFSRHISLFATGNLKQPRICKLKEECKYHMY